VKTSGPPLGPVGGGWWRVCRSRALERKPDTSHDRGGRKVMGTGSWAHELVIIAILAWDMDHGACRETPPLLDALLNDGSIVVDAVFADGARSERHFRVVRVRKVGEGRRWEGEQRDLPAMPKEN
jgi:hypothetical protein